MFALVTVAGLAVTVCVLPAGNVALVEHWNSTVADAVPGLTVACTAMLVVVIGLPDCSVGALTVGGGGAESVVNVVDGEDTPETDALLTARMRTQYAVLAVRPTHEPVRLVDDPVPLTEEGLAGNVRYVPAVKAAVVEQSKKMLVGPWPASSSVPVSETEVSATLLVVGAVEITGGPTIGSVWNEAETGEYVVPALFVAFMRA